LQCLVALGRFHCLMALERFHCLVALERFHCLLANGRFQCLVAFGKFQCLVANGKRRINILFTSFHFPPNKFYLNLFFSILKFILVLNRYLHFSFLFFDL
jgi:hypothetical protein